MNKRTEILKALTDLEINGILKTHQTQQLASVVNEYFDGNKGDYNPKDLAKLFKEKLEAGLTTRDLGAGIAIGIGIGVLISK